MIQTLLIRRYISFNTRHTNELSDFFINTDMRVWAGDPPVEISDAKKCNAIPAVGSVPEADWHRSAEREISGNFVFIYLTISNNKFHFKHAA